MLLPKFSITPPRAIRLSTWVWVSNTGKNCEPRNSSCRSRPRRRRGAAGHGDRCRSTQLPRGRVDDLVARVAQDGEGNPRNLVVARQRLDGRVGAGGDVIDGDDLVGVGQRAFHQFKEAFAQVDRDAGIHLAVIGAVVVGTRAEDAEAERQLALEEPGLLERQHGLARELSRAGGAGGISGRRPGRRNAG